MTAADILKKLEQLGNEGTARVLVNHGAKKPCFGVKVEELKKIQKLVKTDHNLALELFNSGVYDAMYLAGLVMDGAEMSKKEITSWAETNYGSAISSYTVPWVASESKFGLELALKWIESDKEFVAVSGWATLAAIASLKNDDELDLPLYKSLIDLIVKKINTSPNRVRQAMNAYIIGIGCYVSPLTDAALRAAAQIGKVKVDVGDTACKIPDAAEYINKVKARGTLGKKKKTVKC
jgi:3-methyladenine DNA glycosylase AlkD